ncbi:hypothetical protein ACL9RI_08915 [Janthinobacterium sp. Mn2066]|uniref:hypothetical protein n=1 Tax=Janthinobacterium sp. Mn2066 TaxID=3395264 RepID=UPI003BD56012
MSTALHSDTSNTTETSDDEPADAPNQPAQPSLAQLLAQTLAAAPEPLRFNIAQDTLQEAYTALIGAVPHDDRPALIARMRHELDIVAERELGPLNDQRAHARTPDISTEQVMAELQLQERRQRVQDVVSEKLLPGAELCIRLGVTPQALSAALKARRLFALRGPSGDYVYPAFFADPRQDRHTLEKISKILGDLPGAAKWDFFSSPRISLGGKSPLEALAKGKLDAVLAAAHAYAAE